MEDKPLSRAQRLYIALGPLLFALVMGAVAGLHIYAVRHVDICAAQAKRRAAGNLGKGGAQHWLEPAFPDCRRYGCGWDD